MMRSFLLASLATTAFLAGCAASPDGVAPEGDKSLAHAPSDPGAPASTSTATRTFAVRSFDLGASDPSAWKRIGLDIDGMVTTRDSKDVCQLAAGAPPSTHDDGADGIDNSFGANIVPMLVALFGQDVSAHMNASLWPSQRTDLLAIRGADTTADATVSATLNGAAVGHAWIGGGTFVSSPSTQEFQLALGKLGDGAVTGFPTELVLPIEHVQIVAPLADGAWSIDDGVLSGIIPTAQAVQEVHDFVLALHPDESPDMLADFERMVRQAADILVDGKQDQSRPCDGISVGVHFTADARTAQLHPPHPLPSTSEVPRQHLTPDDVKGSQVSPREPLPRSSDVASATAH
jgi:hypothetical protein